MQVVDSDPDAELSWQYLTGPNARRRGRLPASQQHLTQPAATASARSTRHSPRRARLSEKPMGKAHNDATVPGAACRRNETAVSAKHRHFCHTQSFSGMRRNRLTTARMSIQDPFQDLAEQTFHHSISMAEEGQSDQDLPSTGAPTEPQSKQLSAMCVEHVQGEHRSCRNGTNLVPDQAQIRQPQRACRVWNHREWLALCRRFVAPVHV